MEQLKIACDAEKENNSSINLQLSRLRENLESEKVNSATLRINFEKERNEKDSILLRNAQVSQDYEIAVQEKRRQELESIELQNKIEQLEVLLKKSQISVEESSKAYQDAKEKLIQFEGIEIDKEKNEGLEKILKNNLSDMEEQLNDKTKVGCLFFFLFFKSV